MRVVSISLEIVEKVFMLFYASFCFGLKVTKYHRPFGDGLLSKLFAGAFITEGNKRYWFVSMWHSASITSFLIDVIDEAFRS